MNETVDYPGDAPTGPQGAVPPEGSHPQGSHPQGPPLQGPPGYAFGPGAQLPPQAFQSSPPNPGKPNRLNKVAASVGIAAGALVIIAVLFGGGFYLGRETAPVPPPADRSAARPEQGGPMIIPLPRGQFGQPGPGIVIPNGPTIQLPNIFPQLPTFPQVPPTQTPGQPPG